MKFLSTELVISINEQILESTNTVIKYEELDGAVNSIKATMFGKPLYEDKYSAAAHLAYSLCIAHEFIDGNKRTAISAAILFLTVNMSSREEIKVVDFDVGSKMLDMLNHKFTEQQLAEFFKSITHVN